MATKTDIFTDAVRPDPQLFYKREDPSDQRLGEVVLHEPSAYEKANIVIIGCPQDEGVKRNRGRTGAAQAPTAIRTMLYRLPVPSGDFTGRIYDLGDTGIEGSLEDVHDRHLAIVTQILKDGKSVVALGGGNDLSYPDCRALAEASKKIVAINIDSHFDVRADQPRNSGTPYRQLLDEAIVDGERFFELAYKPEVNSVNYAAYLRKAGAHLISLDDLRERTIPVAVSEALADDEADGVFWGFDMDAVRSADAPGVSATYPTGLTAEEACEIARLAGRNKRSRVFEITEVNPTYDIDHRTARLAAMMVVHYLTGQ